MKVKIFFNAKQVSGDVTLTLNGDNGKLFRGTTRGSIRNEIIWKIYASKDFVFD